MGGWMFCRQTLSTVRGSSSLGGGAKPPIGGAGTPFTAGTPTTSTPPCEFANDDTIFGSCVLTLASNVLLYSTRKPSLNRAHTSRMCWTVMGRSRNIIVGWLPTEFSRVPQNQTPLGLHCINTRPTWMADWITRHKRSENLPKGKTGMPQNCGCLAASQTAV